MKYTDEQKRILSLCRKYKGVEVDFTDNQYPLKVCMNGRWYYYNNATFTSGKLEEKLNERCTLKSVGRPKGSTKPSRKVRKFVSLSADQWSKVERIQREQGLKYASHAIGHCIDFFADYCLNEEVSNE